MTASDKNESGFRLGGGHVLAITVAFFAFIFAVNGVMVYLALGTFPGAVTGSSYKASQEYNKEIIAAAEQAKLGWVMSEKAVLTGGTQAVVTVEGRDAAGQPLAGVDFSARFEHPVKQGEDRSGVLAPVPGASGRFAATIAGVEPGQWELVIEGVKDGRRIYRSQNRVVLK